MKALRIISIIISIGYILVGFYLFFANDMEAISLYNKYLEIEKEMCKK